MAKPDLYCPVCSRCLPPVGDRGPWPACPNYWCGRRDRGFSVVFSLGSYEGALRGAITRYKYGGDRRLAAVFAQMVSSYLRSHSPWFEEFDLLTAVPAFVGPGARRDWDPLGRLLGALDDRLGMGWDVVSGIVAKERETPAITGLGWSARQVVAVGALRRALHVADPTLVAGSRILVVDDVFTEGSTLREVARALGAAGASEVAGLVLARRGRSADPSPGPVGRRGGEAAGSLELFVGGT